MELAFTLAKSGIYSKRTGNARVWWTEHAQWLLPVAGHAQ